MLQMRNLFYIDCSETKAEDIKNILYTDTLSSFLYEQSGGTDSVILDEFHALRQDHQQKLVVPLEKTKKRVFICTNSYDKIIPPIQSRTMRVQLLSEDEEQIAQCKERAKKLAIQILKTEKIDYKEESIEDLAQQAALGDRRELVKNLQTFIIWFAKKNNKGMLGKLSI